jgi:N6-L-threonylcarbamoyladenine synthase
MIILGIESSCDETAVGIVTDDRQILAHTLASQYETHALYGGVVPELAARAHLEKVQPLVEKALEEARLQLSDIDAFAATCGPGLIGGVMVGMMAAKSYALALNKPFIAVNHLEAHALTVRLVKEVPFPFLLLLASGGHTQFLAVEDVGHYVLLGRTLDDAIGESFDKVAKMLDLDYPGGPQVEQRALIGDKKRFTLPKPMLHREGCDFSFSGLKTATRLLIESLNPISDQDKNDVCASFQETVKSVIEQRTKRALTLFQNLYPSGNHLVVAGGVASNQVIRNTLETLANNINFVFEAPPISLCTDNGAMIAWAGVERFKKRYISPLNFKARPRWPLNEINL